MTENNDMLSLEDCKKIVDDFKSLLKRWNCKGRIHFSGGDPLLYPYFFELLRYARSQILKLRIGILGNPELLTEDIVKKLKELNLYSYQVSIDGMEKTHDYFRYKGSFRKTMEGLNLLKKGGINTVVMTTVSRRNLKEIPNVIDLVVKEKVDFFGFKRFVPIGTGNAIKKEALISPDEFKWLLSEANKRYKKYKDCVTFFGEGEPLWKLFQFEEGLFSPSKEMEEKDLIWGGCGIGICALTILEDGTVLACRRLPIPVGKVPEQKIKDIFIFSNELNKLRNTERMEKCKDCEILPYCRGCRAMAYAVSGDYFKPDPQCWKEVKKLNTRKEVKSYGKSITRKRRIVRTRSCCAG